MTDEAVAPADERGQTGRREGATLERGSEPDADGGAGRLVPADSVRRLRLGERAAEQDDDRPGDDDGQAGGRLTHASWFSGAGGLDIGLHRAGWRTVSFSEIDPYASAILEQRWPGVPNLGDIVALDAAGSRQQSRVGLDGRHSGGTGQQRRWQHGADGVWSDATLWTGGFPCQDLSVAGKRAGLAGERSGLAFAFLDLVREHRPPAIVLENVPGLLSSNAGRDLGELLRRLGDLRYGWAYRVLDAQWFGVPQRRRRVFILALDTQRYPDESSAAEVLAVGTRCERDHQAEREAWADAAGRAGDRPTFAVRTGHQGANGHGASDAASQAIVDGSPPDAARVRATPGMAGRVDGGGGVAATLNSGGNDGGFRTEPGEHLTIEGGYGMTAHDPQGLDSHRYRVIGNGVAAPVAEWLGRRLRRYLDEA